MGIMSPLNSLPSRFPPFTARKLPSLRRLLALFMLAAASICIAQPASAQLAVSTSSVPASAAVSTVLVTGLTPNGSYGVSAAPGSSGNLISITAGPGNATADAAGVLRITLGN